MKAEIEVLQAGLFSSVQDRGRFGYGSYGVPQSGAMDQQAAAMANLLLHNDPKAAVLEITLQGPSLRFPKETQIVITGADLEARLGEFNLKNYEVFKVMPGQVLSFGQRISGFRAYLGIKGGFQTQEVLGSKSWCKGVTPHHRLEKGMVLPYIASTEDASTKYSAVKPDVYITSNTIEVFPGPEYDLLSASAKENLLKMTFSAGKESDRMGIQFREKFEHNLEPIITGPVVPGTVQLTPSGTLIVLMRDCQTTGGYPRVMQLSHQAMNVLAQKLPGEKLYIRVIKYK